MMDIAVACSTVQQMFDMPADDVAKIVNNRQKALTEAAIRAHDKLTIHSSSATHDTIVNSVNSSSDNSSVNNNNSSPAAAASVMPAMSEVTELAVFLTQLDYAKYIQHFLAAGVCAISSVEALTAAEWSALKIPIGK